MNVYTFTLKSDTGKYKFSVYGSNLQEAITKVLDHELAPERAIINIKIKYAKP